MSNFIAHSPEQYKTCAGPSTFSGQCGSSYEHAAPNCCPGLACEEKRCVPITFENPIVPQDSCEKNKLNLFLLFKTDMHSQSQNQFLIEERVDMKWLNIIKKFKDLPNNKLFAVNTC